MRLERKVAIITGSTSGIELAVAKLFLNEEAKVALAARSVTADTRAVTKVTKQPMAEILPFTERGPVRPELLSILATLADRKEY